MTTGRINQVATSSFVMPQPFYRKQHEGSQVCVDIFELRPCISFTIVLYHCSAPAPASQVLGWGATPPETQAQLHQRHEIFYLCSKLRRAALFGACNFEWTVETTIDSYNSIRVQVIQSSDKQHSVLKSKKRKASPKTRKSKICSMPPGSGRPATREVAKQEERK